MLKRKTKNYLSPKASESTYHKAIIQWANHHPILREWLIHYPSGGARTKKLVKTAKGLKWVSLEGKALKAMGAKKGIPDLYLIYPVSPYLGYWQELKRFDKKDTKREGLSDEQQSWIVKLRKIGFKVDVIFSFEESRRGFLEYLYPHKIGDNNAVL